MKKLLDIVSQKIGLTKTEINTILFVLVVFTFGWFANYSKIKLSENSKIKYEYNFEDSLFKALNDKKNDKSIPFKKKEKRVDSEVELSDFSNGKLDSKTKSIPLCEEHSININTANEGTLKKIPGIGSKTAIKIILLRTQKGGFSSLDELTDVKGIGLKKLNKIKKFLYLK